MTEGALYSEITPIKQNRPTNKSSNPSPAIIPTVTMAESISIDVGAPILPSTSNIFEPQNGLPASPDMTRPRSSVLSERLEGYLAEHPREIDELDASKMREFIGHIRQQEYDPAHKLPWIRYFLTLDDFSFFHKLNSEWQGMTASQLGEKTTGGRNFNNALNSFLNRNDPETNIPLYTEEEKEQLRLRIYLIAHSKQADWSSMSIDDLRVFKNTQTEMQGLSRSEIYEKFPGYYGIVRRRINSKDPKTNIPLYTEEEKEQLRSVLLAPSRQIGKQVDWLSMDIDDLRVFKNTQTEMQGLSRGEIKKRFTGYYDAVGRRINSKDPKTNIPLYTEEEKEQLRNVLLSESKYKRRIFLKPSNLSNDVTFRPYVRKLPNNFKRINSKTRVNVPANERAESIGALIEIKEPESVTFVKGEALEQVVGSVLTYLHEGSIVYPQFCLRVDQSGNKISYGTRADFRVGNDIVEVKWGNAEGNILETLSRQQQFLKANSHSYNHLLVILEERTYSTIPDGVKVINVQKLIQDIDNPDLRGVLGTVFEILKEVGSEHGAENVAYLEVIRDFFYNITNEANKLDGMQRKDYLRNVLFTNRDTDFRDRDSMIGYMKKHVVSPFSPLEAHVQIDSEIYRTKIDPRELQRENPEKYTVTYKLGDVEFSSKEDRDLAVLIEMSDAYGSKQINEYLDDPDEVQIRPVFYMSDGRKFSHYKDGEDNDPKIPLTLIEDMEDAKQILGLNDENYTFAQDYINEFGLNC